MQIRRSCSAPPGQTATTRQTGLPDSSGTTTGSRTTAPTPVHLLVLMGGAIVESVPGRAGSPGSDYLTLATARADTDVGGRAGRLRPPGRLAQKVGKTLGHVVRGFFSQEVSGID